MKTFGDHLDQTRQYEQEILEFAYLTKQTHEMRELGLVDSTPIYLFESKSPNGILVSSGWQGDEPAGWAASKVLCKSFSRVSFLPYASPACFKSRQHRNDYGKNVDRGWPNTQTPEGVILNNNLETLIRLSQEGYISLQEDPKRFICYFYSWKASLELEERIEIKLKQHFPLTDGAKHVAPNGMFAEHLVSHGVKTAIQLETPADGSYTISKRIDCLVDTAREAIKLLKP